MVYKIFLAPNFPICWIRLAEKQKEEEHRQLQSVMYFTQKHYFVGPYYAGPKWCYFSCCVVKRAVVIC